MHELVISVLLFQGFSAVSIVLGVTLLSILPERRPLLEWVFREPVSATEQARAS
jgi:hypothetical protein